MVLFWHNQQISGAIIIISLDSGMTKIRERTRHTQNKITGTMSMIKHFGDQAAVDETDLGDLFYMV